MAIKAVGIYQSDEEAAQHMHSNGLKAGNGNLKYEDVNNDGKIGLSIKMICNMIPKITYVWIYCQALRYKRRL